MTIGEAAVLIPVWILFAHALIAAIEAAEGIGDE